MTTELKWTKENLRKAREMTADDYDAADSMYINSILNYIDGTNISGGTEYLVSEQIVSRLKDLYKASSNKIDTRSNLEVFHTLDKILKARTDFDLRVTKVDSKYHTIEHTLIIDWSVE